MAKKVCELSSVEPLAPISVGEQRHLAYVSLCLIVMNAGVKANGSRPKSRRFHEDPCRWLFNVIKQARRRHAPVRASGAAPNGLR